MENSLILGFDPGGKKAFGVAALLGDCAEVATVSCVNDAVDWAHNNRRNRAPKAVGIDTLLHWSGGKAGWRDADDRLRDKYFKCQKSIISPNSLYGSMAVGGMALAIKLREKWPKVILNETHPKVIYFAELKRPYPRKKGRIEEMEWLKKRYGLKYVSGDISSEHAFDALLSACVTRRGIDRKWKCIVDQASIFPIEGVKYLWPCALKRPAD